MFGSEFRQWITRDIRFRVSWFVPGIAVLAFGWSIATKWQHLEATGVRITATVEDVQIHDDAVLPVLSFRAAGRYWEMPMGGLGHFRARRLDLGDRVPIIIDLKNPDHYAVDIPHALERAQLLIILGLLMLAVAFVPDVRSDHD